MKTKKQLMESALKEVKQYGLSRVCSDPIKNYPNEIRDEDFNRLKDEIVTETLYYEKLPELLGKII